MEPRDVFLHVRGEAVFVDDALLPAEHLFAAIRTSHVAHGHVRSLDIAPAMAVPGIYGVFTARDIPGENQVGKTILDEPLLAESEVHFVGQPLAIVVGESAEAARRAARAIQVEIDPLPAIYDVRQAFAEGSLIAPPRTFSSGDVESAWEQCSVVVSGTVESGSQEHVYMETQSAFALPTDRGGVKVVSATQSPSMVQLVVARILGLPMHEVEVEVPRLGGGFGGKEDQATHWAAMAALAAWRLKKPVKLVLTRHEDMTMTGKRHPYLSDYKLGLDAEGHMLAYEVTFYQNGGAVADLSPAILERSLFHATNAYAIPHVKAVGISCRTHLPPNTAFRGFGGPQALFVLECAIFKAAEALGVEPREIQKRNLLQDGDAFPYGARVERCRQRRCWDVAEQKYNLQAGLKEVRQYNGRNAWRKKGLALMPICFGISFTSTFLNQAGAFVNVYVDGSVGISTSAVEMGQGVNAKIQEVAARIFSIRPERIKLETTSTSRIANMPPTAASTGADLNGHATRLACLDIVERLKDAAARCLGKNAPHEIEIRDEAVYASGEATELTWEKLVNLAYFDRVSLCAQAHYATPDIFFDRDTNKGNPFAYYAYGTALVEASLDCLRGTCSIDAVRVVHDFGRSLHPLVDLGQMEGGIVQGVGWMLLEEVMHDADGRLLTDTLATYKIPDIHSIPGEIQVHFLEDAENPPGIFQSKTVGEPPFLYGIGAYFALLQAMKAFRPDAHIPFSSPMTPEKVLLALYPGDRPV